MTLLIASLLTLIIGLGYIAASIRYPDSMIPDVVALTVLLTWAPWVLML